MADNNFIASVDIGSHKTVVLLAEEVDGRLEVFGHGISKSAGVKKGLINDIKKAAQAIEEAAHKAYLSCGAGFHNVSVNISDPHLTVLNREGQITITGGEISEQDLDLAIKSARAVPTLTNKQVINSVSNRYTLDKDPTTHQGIVVDQPIGQEAETLEVSMHIVTVSNQCVNAVDQSIREGGLGLINIVLNSMASSEAYITQDEKDEGICLVDMGAGVTNLSVFTKGGITYSAVIQNGGNQVTQDIADAFDTSFKEAERLKLKHGNAQIKTIREDRLIQFKQIEDPKDCERYLSHQSLVEVIEQSYLDLFSQIRQNLKSQKLYRSLKSGFVLTGGASKVKNCDALLLSCFKIRAKQGRVNTDKITADHRLLEPEYACALGLLLFNYDESDLRVAQEDDKGNFFDKIKDTFTF